jgi:hypothetical protein
MWFLGNFFAHMWLEIWEALHTPNARWLAYRGSQIFAWEFMEVLNCWLVPTGGSHENFTHILGEFYWPRIFLGGIKHGSFMCIPSFNCYNLKSHKDYSCPFSPSKQLVSHVSRSYTWTPLYFQTCPWKFCNQHRVKCTQNNPFISLGS